jgi:hypothetical protein
MTSFTGSVDQNTESPGFKGLNPLNEGQVFILLIVIWKGPRLYPAIKGQHLKNTNNFTGTMHPVRQLLQSATLPH